MASPKFYLVDPGVARALAGRSREPLEGAERGPLLETWVLHELRAAADAGRIALIASGLTLLEVLVVPYRCGNQLLAQHYEALLTRSRGMQLVDPTRDHFRAAAQLRASTGMRTADVILAATALGAGCTVLVTNDRRLPAVPGLRVLQLSDY